jgi:rubredoxin
MRKITTTVTHVCDRCGVEIVEQDADPSDYDPPPAGWIDVRGCLLCPTCASNLVLFLHGQGDFAP